MCLIPMVSHRDLQMVLLNCEPLMEVMAAGMPKRVTQAVMKAPAKSSAVVEASGAWRGAQLGKIMNRVKYYHLHACGCVADELEVHIWSGCDAQRAGVT